MRDMRLNCNVTRGEIDNTQRGLVVVTLWVCGEEAPCRINLEGDCLRDLAGCKIAFTNKQFNEFQPYPVSLSALSQGVVGEITASARLYTVTKQNDLGEYENPCYTNVMRLEFFTSLGRVIFECLNFETELISLDWQMTDGEEFAQEASNFANWQAHIEATPKEELNTQPYLLSDLFDEIFQRFGNSIDFDQHEAALMGWDGTLSALADARELKPADFDQDLLLDDALLGDQFMKASCTIDIS